jgi:TonB family protein
MRVDTTMVFITPATRQPEKPEPPKQVPITSLTQLKGFQTLVAPSDIPATLPPIDLRERFDPRDYSGTGVEGGSGAGIVLPGADAGQVYAVALVTEQPDRLAGPIPAYPPILKQAGIQGRVTLEAVVDTAGRVEPGSVRVVSSPNPLFDPPSVAALRATLFRPARVNGRAVRVLIKLPFDFVIRW